ncbi:MAG: carbon-nitrogen hydrolase family protein [Stackebrandtia sp.]
MNQDLPPKSLRVGAATVESIPAAVEANVATAVAVLEAAAEDDVELLVFGELFLPGYNPPALSESPGACDTPPQDRRLEPLRAAARRTGVNALIGASVPAGDDRCIAMLLADAGGRIRDVYHKQNLCGRYERELFVPGEHSAAVVCQGWKLGLGICYDAAFPEHARAAALDGCHAYVTGGAFVSGGDHRRDLYHRARALDNTFYVVFANAQGGPNPWTFSGGSNVYDPQGCAVSKPVGASLVVGELDPFELSRTRSDHTMLADVPRGEFPRYFTEM